MSPVDGDTEDAELEQRDHLLRSLDDLDTEHAAGDLDDDDFRTLAADYTSRAAAVIRAIERPTPTPTDSAGPAASSTRDRDRAWLRIAVWVLSLGAMAVVAGLLLARFSGSRGAGDTVTGDIRTSIREQLFEAEQAFAAGDLTGAIDIYDDVLEQQPSNAAALAYKGWFTNLGGDPAAARTLVEESVAVDPSYADARVFAASLALEQDDPEAAAAHLAAFDTLDAAPFVEQLVADFGLRERVAAALDPSSPAAVQLEAEALVEQGQLLNALMLFDEALADRPDDVDLLAARGWLMARVPDDELREIGEASLDQALSIDPSHPESLVYRAFVRAQLGEIAGARADLATFDALDTHPPELTALVEALGLRELLAAAN